MGSDSIAVNFLEYTQAVARMRRRAALRRAVIGGSANWETLSNEEDESRDLAILAAWESSQGGGPFVF